MRKIRGLEKALFQKYKSNLIIVDVVCGVDDGVDEGEDEAEVAERRHSIRRFAIFAQGFIG